MSARGCGALLDGGESSAEQALSRGPGTPRRRRPSRCQRRLMCPPDRRGRQVPAVRGTGRPRRAALAPAERCLTGDASTLRLGVDDPDRAALPRVATRMDDTRRVGYGCPADAGAEDENAEGGGEQGAT